jgi:hypothetical protein
MSIPQKQAQKKNLDKDMDHFRHYDYSFESKSGISGWSRVKPQIQGAIWIFLYRLRVNWLTFIKPSK